MRLGQRALAERPRIQTSGCDVEIRIERTIRFHLHRQSDALEPVDHNAPTGQQLLTAALAFIQTVLGEAGERSVLRGGVRAQVVVGGQVVHGFEHVVVIGHDGPAETPSGHAEELGEAVAHDRLVVAFEHGFDFAAIRFAIGQVKVGFVHDTPHAMLARILAHALEHIEVDGGAGGIGRRGDHNRLGAVGMVLGDEFRGEVEAGGGAGGHVHHGSLEAFHQLAIAGV